MCIECACEMRTPHEEANKKTDVLFLGYHEHVPVLSQQKSLHPGLENPGRRPRGLRWAKGLAYLFLVRAVGRQVDFVPRLSV